VLPTCRRWWRLGRCNEQESKTGRSPLAGDAVVLMLVWEINAKASPASGLLQVAS
jgi:hypothetical protein